MISENKEEALFILFWKVGSYYDHKTLLKCVLYICKAVQKVSASQVLVRKVIYPENLQNKKYMKNLQKTMRAGTLNMFFFLIRPNVWRVVDFLLMTKTFPK